MRGYAFRFVGGFREWHLPSDCTACALVQCKRFDPRYALNPTDYQAGSNALHVDRRARGIARRPHGQ
jgi:hypothetical protein